MLTFYELIAVVSFKNSKPEMCILEDQDERRNKKKNKEYKASALRQVDHWKIKSARECVSFTMIWASHKRNDRRYWKVEKKKVK